MLPDMALYKELGRVAGLHTAVHELSLSHDGEVVAAASTYSLRGSRYLISSGSTQRKRALISTRCNPGPS